MVQVSSSIPGPSGRLTLYTYVCSFCGDKFQTDTNYDRAKDHCCQSEPCKLERDRLRKIAEREAVQMQGAKARSWDERVGSHGPGEEVSSFIAKILGMKFTPSGGITISLIVPPEYKREVFDVTDYSGMLMHVVMSRPEDS